MYFVKEEEALQTRVFVTMFGCRRNNQGSCFAAQQTGELDGLQAAFVRSCYYAWLEHFTASCALKDNLEC